MAVERVGRVKSTQRTPKGVSEQLPGFVHLRDDEAAELHWLGQEGSPSLSRRARVVLLRARGESLSAIARQVGVSRVTVRRWLRRFVETRLAGLHDASSRAGTRRVTGSVRDAIIRIAMSPPSAAGEPFAGWSLRKLQLHILRRGLVKHISVEGLRQILRGTPLPREFWQRKRSAPLQLTPEQRAGLEHLVAHAPTEVARRARIVLARANGLDEAEIAAAVGMGRSSVRHWLRRFRNRGLLGLQAPRRPMRPLRFTPEVRRNILALASRSPAEFGFARPYWSLRSLRTALLQRAIVRDISIQHLRRILVEGGVQLGGRPRSATQGCPQAGTTG
ncbi:MAG: hypothetical protein KatS3mg077_2853 [Candidatus Binatia bacterium]|nr:MAG: hypothetical protein KatS3mg077_2853 [Candidatus Binatia bacterium]